MKNLNNWQFDDAKKFIDKAFKERKLLEVSNYLDTLNILTDFQNIDQVDRFIDILFYLDATEYDMRFYKMKILPLLYLESSEQIEKKYGIEGKYLKGESFKGERFKELMAEKLKGHYPNYPNVIIRYLLMGAINNEFKEELLFTPKELLEIANNILDDYIEHDKHINKKHLDLLYSCIESKDTQNRVILEESACSKIKALIEANPKGYFEKFVFLGMSSSHEDFNTVACEPFWQQIFGSDSEFENFLSQQSPETAPNIILIKNFWRLYKNNNYKQIEFQGQGSVQKMIDNNLIEEIKKLDKLLNVEKDYRAIEKDRRRNPNNTKSYINKYKSLSNRLDKINLYITKNGDIRKKINESIRSLESKLII